MVIVLIRLLVQFILICINIKDNQTTIQTFCPDQSGKKYGYNKIIDRY